MRAPPLAQVTCPGCGAPIRIDVWSDVAICPYCKRSSFVHRPNVPVTPPAPGFENYGHIHVPKTTVNKSIALVLVMAFFGVDLVIGLVVVVAMLVSQAASRTSTISWSSPTPPTINIPEQPTIVTPGANPFPVDMSGANAGPNCQKAVRCCKAIQPQNTGCDSLAMIGEYECGRQVEILETAARKMKKRCD
jgi:hypothetical protein